VAYECTIDQELAEHCCMGAGRRLLFTLFCVFGVFSPVCLECTSASDCLERLVSELKLRPNGAIQMYYYYYYYYCYVLSGT